MDARQRRSREKLKRAILALAADARLSDIQASDVAAAAEVNRSTFYEHASSPAALLEDVLTEELDQIRVAHLVDVAPDAAAASIAVVTDAVLQHVESHERIYRRGLLEADASASLHPMLSAHFEGSMTLLFAQHTIHLAATGVPNSPGLLPEMASRFIANGAVGAIGVWLGSPAPRDRAAFLHDFRLLLPEWFPMAAD